MDNLGGLHTPALIFIKQGSEEAQTTASRMTNQFPRKVPFPTMGRSSAILAFVCLLANSLFANAETVPVVADRQKDMKEIAASAKTIADMFKAPGTYSSTKFKEASEAISDRAGQRLTDHFATVTAAQDSKATEVIASERDRFAELARDLKTYADALSSAAHRHPNAMSDDMRMNDREPMGGGPLGTGIRNEASMSTMSAEHAFHLMLQTCTSCHSRFRSN